jgi:hypothetical protein
MNGYPEQELEKAHVVISHERKDGRSFFEIKYVPNERRIPIEELAHILTGGVGVVIRAAGQGDSVTEHELMKTVVEHLTNEFVSTDSFNDVRVDKDML